MIDLDICLELMTQAVNTLDDGDLERWVSSINMDADPRELPDYQCYKLLFTKLGGPLPWASEAWPTMHLIIKLAFLELARTRIEVAPLELMLSQYN